MLPLLERIERYYDEVPRAFASAEDWGPLTLFVRRGSEGWPFYARPRLGHDGPLTADDVRRVRARQRELGVLESFEWVAETAPGMAEAAREAGLAVARHPLLVLPDRAVRVAAPPEVRLTVLDASLDRLSEVVAAIQAGFTDDDRPAEPSGVDGLRESIAAGSTRMVGAFDAAGPIGGGTHGPRGEVTELTGIAVLPRARGRGVGAAVTARLVEHARGLGVRTVFLSAGSERVARIYERVGFERLATACIAEPDA